MKSREPSPSGHPAEALLEVGKSGASPGDRGDGPSDYDDWTGEDFSFC